MDVHIAVPLLESWWTGRPLTTLTLTNSRRPRWYATKYIAENHPLVSIPDLIDFVHRKFPNVHWIQAQTCTTLTPMERDIVERYSKGVAWFEIWAPIRQLYPASATNSDRSFRRRIWPKIEDKLFPPVAAVTNLYFLYGLARTPTLSSEWWISPGIDGSTAVKTIHTSPACDTAIEQAFWDARLRFSLSLEVWLFLRRVDPDLKPWNFDQCIFDVNDIPQDHVLRRQCLMVPRLHFLQDVVQAFKRQRALFENTRVWCNKHKIYEKLRCPMIYQILQFGAGLMTFDQWQRNHRFVGESKFLSGSHLCGNEWCCGLFCVRWESQINNNLRRTCHGLARKAARDGSPIPPCSCGQDPPCDVQAAVVDPIKLREETLAVVQSTIDGPFDCPSCGKPIPRSAAVMARCEYDDDTLDTLCKNHLRKKHGWLLTDGMINAARQTKANLDYGPSNTGLPALPASPEP